MNDDLLLNWSAVDLDIGGQPSNVQGYKVWDMSDALNPAEVDDVTETTSLLVGFVSDPNNAPPVAVSAYNAQGDGARSATVIAGPPIASVPDQVGGVTAVVIPR